MGTGQNKPQRGLPQWALIALVALVGVLYLCLMWARSGDEPSGTAGSPYSPLPPLTVVSPAPNAPAEPALPTQIPGPAAGPAAAETDGFSEGGTSTVSSGSEEYTLDNIPPYSGDAWIVLGDNVPDFSGEEMTTTAFESYSELDELGRCGAAYACVCVETMPTEDRGEIWMVKPTGWQSVKYDFVDGESLYNRCHLIGFQLTGENANAENLITGTRYMNVSGMLPFEDEVAEYVKRTKGHVLYRVTPVYMGEDLVASGVRMEGYSVEDDGESVCFDVFCYNCQPGVEINYADGSNHINEDDPIFDGEVRDYVLNTGSRKFHLPKCSGAQSIGAKKRREYTGTREMLIVQGYVPCGECRP